ncbi:nuclear distribution protein nudE-like 1 isoform X1 [Phlebotomus argentipes]|uniref:nuclear distribution protein nudE-like 1 isoform X1 n=2 Tax=Phlebotomus argentipes TaxID=94469 RepID=UPI0028932ACD|nr:nuclear distribution protein nudE-like 1 isoform X1 [Phlebotomus argentipes]
MSSDKHEEEIYRLNVKIKQLFATVEKASRQNSELLNENRLLNAECVNLRRENMENSTINLQLRLDLDAVTSQRDDLYEANQKLKLNVNRLSERSRDQAEKIAKMEHMIKSQTSTIRAQSHELRALKSRPEVIRGLADVPGGLARHSTAADLEHVREEMHSLEEKLDEAYDVIEGLEFELESLDFLEAEHERMEDEIEALKREIRQMKDQQGADDIDGAPKAHQDAEKKHRREVLHKKLECLHQKQHKRDE